MSVTPGRLRLNTTDAQSGKVGDTPSGSRSTGQARANGPGDLYQGSRSNVGTGVRTLGLTPHLARCWNVLTPPSRGLLCVALYISQKQPKRCNSLHEKPKYGSKLSQNCHIELRNCHLELKTLTFPYLDALPSFLAVRSSTVEHRSNTSFCQVLEQGRCSNTLPRLF